MIQIWGEITHGNLHTAEFVSYPLGKWWLL